MPAERKQLAGQYKFNPDTKTVAVVGSKASERPAKEKQASLLDWAEETEKLAQWSKAQQEHVEKEQK